MEIIIIRTVHEIDQLDRVEAPCLVAFAHSWARRHALGEVRTALTTNNYKAGFIFQWCWLGGAHSPLICLRGLPFIDNRQNVVVSPFSAFPYKESAVLTAGLDKHRCKHGSESVRGETNGRIPRCMVDA